MINKIFYWQSDTETARDIASSLGYRSEFSRSRPFATEKNQASRFLNRPFLFLTARDINELDEDEIIAFFNNRKPIRAKRMDWRGPFRSSKETRHYSADTQTPSTTGL